MDGHEMNFIIYNNKRFKHPIRYSLLLILLVISLLILMTVWKKQQQFTAQEESQLTLQNQLEKLNKQNTETPKNLISTNNIEIIPIINELNQYSRETILLKKLEYKKSLNQFEISGETTSIEDLGTFKESLLNTRLIKNIDIFSTSSLIESKKYKVEFSLKGAL